MIALCLNINLLKIFEQGRVACKCSQILSILTARLLEKS